MGLSVTIWEHEKFSLYKPGKINFTENSIGNYRRLQVKGQVTSPAVQKPTGRYWMSNHELKRLEVLAFSRHFFHFCHKGFCAYPRYIHLQSGQNVLQLDIPKIVPVLSLKWILSLLKRNNKYMCVYLTCSLDQTTKYQLQNHKSWLCTQILTNQIWFYSCKNITTTLIQISRLFYFGFFSKTNHQMII